ncbi:MAG: ion transporter [Pseudomonadota bacterium]
MSPLNWLLTVCVLASILVAALLTEPTLAPWGRPLHAVLGLLALIFTVEYAARWWTRWDDPDWLDGRRPLSRALGPWGWPLSAFALLDLAALLFAWAEVIVGGGIGWAVMLRVARLLRVFALDHASPLGRAGDELLAAMRERRLELALAGALAGAALLCISVGIYIAERAAQPEAFGSIPRAAWWTVVTVTTVGYGDVVPTTAAGKLIGAAAALLSIGLIALPAGIFAAAFSDAVQRARRDRDDGGRDDTDAQAPPD